ncbi:hypothetical protein MBM_02339 [Drepanopeziza brunnea f. sp. 'multigermtubi' MB_m1]|uniref:Uncharacterized protein n=1 Tax=Marssonina brunnea f. sp. multigermtubi (strain MB_m1) TaxID=1072389 RepID=K1X294_MARBU|nr:uncharacterized protein MBM_02339 [Drepanopeziza brunnea f. sp. 'multigermtubi' MB_m1]EKD19102.1 hypothetical protein MBM_02339 [Drepanopeziza brunnea f. sp. 'multigermtubi' MB_m1]
MTDEEETEEIGREIEATGTEEKENLRTSLSECFKKLVKKLKGIQSSLRPGLKDDRSLANKLYSACKNVLKTTIARINLTFTFTAVIADIRKAIAFATETSRPFAKAIFGRSSKRFSIRLKDDTNFNDTVYVDVIHFNVHDLGTNFNSATFRSYFKGISSTLKQMLVKAYYSVGLVERYYVLVRRAFEIVTKELSKALKEDRLQMAIKAINDIARLNSLVLTLFVFKTLSRLTEQDRLAAST